MIKLYQFARVWGIPNLSHFCTKVETYLRMTELLYEVIETIPPKAPKGKLPYIEDGDNKIADSHFIIDYLKKTYGDPLDGDLTPEDAAVATAMQRLMEEHLFWVTMYTRWNTTPENWRQTSKAIFCVFPPFLRDIVALTYRHLIRRQIHGHGLGRHRPDEIYALGEADLDAVSAFLGSKAYFLGDKPSSLDATAFGFLINTIGCPIESPVKAYALTKDNLSAYCDRMKAQFFPELTA